MDTTGIFEGIKEGLEDAIEYAKGDKTKGHANIITLSPERVKKIRQETGLSQKDFSNVLHVSPKTYQNWEQGRRTVSGPSAALLTIFEKEPAAAKRALQIT